MSRSAPFEKALAKLVSQGEDPLLSTLPQEHLIDLSQVFALENIAQSLLNKTNLTQERITAQYENKIEHRALLLQPTTSTHDSRVSRALRSQQKLEGKKKPRPLSASEKRKFGFGSLPETVQDYSLYTSLNTLWSGYVREIVRGGGNEAKLLKADYHGAHLRVVKSSNPSILFITGIVVKETRHTFVVCTTDNKFKTLPKKCTVFEFCVSLTEPIMQDRLVESLPLMRWEIHGEHFGFRAAERVGKKFKGKFTTDF